MGGAAREVCRLGYCMELFLNLLSYFAGFVSPTSPPPPPLNFLGKYLCQKLGGVVGCLEVGCDLVPSLLLRRPFDTIDKVFS